MKRGNSSLRNVGVDLSTLSRMTDIPLSSSAAAPKADLTNAGYLFGDPDLYGDTDLYGDAEEGDPDPLAFYNFVSGDPKFSRREKKAFALGAGGGAAATISAQLIARAIKRHNARKAALKDMLARDAARQSVNRTMLARRDIQRFTRNSKIGFMAVQGAKLTTAPIDMTTTFPAEGLKFALDQQTAFTPFYNEIVPATYAGLTWTATTAVQPTNDRFYGCIFLNIGTNALNASPGSILTVTVTMPTTAGTLTSQVFTMTYSAGYDIRMVIFPWNLVTNKALYVIGKYGTVGTGNISVSVTGIPEQSAVTLTVPGSLSSWTIGMRNALAGI